MTQNVEMRINTLIEEAWGDLRNQNMALQLQGMSPEQRQQLMDTLGRAKMAGKQGLGMGIAGALGGALGGGIAAGPVGAALGAGGAGLATGLGGGLGMYKNLSDMSKMSPEDIEKFAAIAEKEKGANYAKRIREMGKSL
jgi:hypothetical protein